MSILNLSNLNLKFLLYCPMRILKGPTVEYLRSFDIDLHDSAFTFLEKIRSIILDKISLGEISLEKILSELHHLPENENFSQSNVLKILNTEIVQSFAEGINSSKQILQIIEQLDKKSQRPSSMIQNLRARFDDLLVKGIISNSYMKKISLKILSNVFLDSKQAELVYNFSKNLDSDVLAHVTQILFKNPKLINDFWYSMTKPQNITNIIVAFSQLNAEEKMYLVKDIPGIISSNDLRKFNLFDILTHQMRSSEKFVDSVYKLLENYVNITLNSDIEGNVKGFISNVYDQKYINKKILDAFEIEKNILNNIDEKTHNNGKNKLLQIFYEDKKLPKKELDLLYNRIISFCHLSDKQQKEILKKQNSEIKEKKHQANTIDRKFYSDIFQDRVNTSNILHQVKNFILTVLQIVVISLVKILKVHNKPIREKIQNTKGSTMLNVKNDFEANLRHI